jgi:peptide/nickel transport system substrate-binding protein
MTTNYWTHTLRQRLSRRRAIASAGGAGLGAALLAACGGDGDSGGEQASGLLSKPVDTAKQAKKGGIYLSSRSNDIDHSDPHFTTQAAPGTALTFSRLFRRKPGYLEPQPVAFIGDLAESWEFSGDKRQLTVKLKTNAKWHNTAPVNGRNVDAQDIVYTFKRVSEVGANRSLLANSVSPSAPIESMTAIDYRNVSNQTAFPSAALIAMLSATISGYLWVLPRESEDKYDPRRVNIGSGPWAVADYTPSVRIIFKKHTGWHSADSIFIDELHQPVVLEYATGLAQFKAGSIYGPGGVRGFVVRPADVLSTKRDVPQMELYLEDPSGQGEFAFFGWNPAYGQETAFRDKRLRQAFSMSMDRDLWIDTFYEIPTFRAEGIPMESLWNSAITTVWPGWWLDPRGKDLGAAAKNFEFNVAEAKKLVSAAGHPNGIELKAQYPLTGYSAEYLKHVEVVMNFASAAGLNLKTTPVSFTTDWRPKVADNNGDFEGISFRPDATASLPDPVEFMYAGFHYRGGAGYTGFFPANSSFKQGDPRLNELLDKARGEFDDNKRIAAIHELQKIHAEEQYIVRFPGTSNSFSMNWPVIRNANVYRGDLSLVSEWLDPTKPPMGQG